MDEMCRVFGILNLTPDSFSDGGVFVDDNKALRHIENMVSDGAYGIDIGAESSRPGAETDEPNEPNETEEMDQRSNLADINNLPRHMVAGEI